MNKNQSLRTLLVIAIIFQSFFSFSQMSPVGDFEHHQDVGDPTLKGNTVYNAADQTFLMSGSGKNIWAKQDQFQFAWKKIKEILLLKRQPYSL
ncbi:MAG: hypothetical protein WDN26_09370 [Chitinophagaceae bacterium]